MTKGYTLPDKLKLVFDHLHALGTLNDYVNGSMETEMQGLTDHVARELNRDVLRRADWEDLQSFQGYLYSNPRDIKSWQVVPDDNLALQLWLSRPVYGDGDTSVNLYVPKKWKQRQQFLVSLPPLSGFTYVRDCDESDVDDFTTMIK